MTVRRFTLGDQVAGQVFAQSGDPLAVSPLACAAYPIWHALDRLGERPPEFAVWIDDLDIETQNEIMADFNLDEDEADDPVPT